VAPHVPQPFTVVAGEGGVHLGQLSRGAFSQLCQLAQTQVRDVTHHVWTWGREHLFWFHLHSSHLR
jgi:hypothetical protein